MAKKWARFSQGGSFGKLGRKPMSRVPGLNEAVNQINIKIAKTKMYTLQGMIEAAKFIRRETETKPPVTPVDKGNLKASWFTVSSNGIEPDVEGKSGNFVRNPRVKMKVKDFKAAHTNAIESAKAEVESHKVIGPMVIMGYSAPYALFVHEMEYTRPGVQWSRKGSGGKWLEAAFKRNKNKIVDLITEKAKIK